MYRVLCDGHLLHDSNINEYTLISPTLNLEVNKSGEFTFQITKSHKHYDDIINKKSIIDIYEDGVWIWSGRPLLINTAMKLYKTVTCEGVLSFLHDSIQRHKVYQDISVVDYFTALITLHNEDVDEGKRFKVGNVTVEDSNDSLYRISNYEDTFQTIQDRLVSRLGGYLIIRIENGERIIDYVKDYPIVTSQAIKFGENIINIGLDENADDMISAIIPLGAKIKVVDEEGNEKQTDERLSIASVNDGLDYITNEDAVERIGLIKTTAVFDDVTVPSNLMRKGYEALIEKVYSKLTISLSVFDRKYIDKNIKGFKLGATVIADSKKHGLDNQEMMISKISMSLVDVTKTKIETGLTKRSLTDNITNSNNQFVEKVGTIVSDYVKNEQVNVITPQLKEMSSSISQTAENIKSEVSSKYIAIDEKEAIYSHVASLISQSDTNITMSFTTSINNVENTVTLNKNELDRYIRFSEAGIELGDKLKPTFKTNITNTEINFTQNGQKIAYISNSKLYILEAQFINKMSIGNDTVGFYDWVVRINGHLSLKYRGK